MGGASRSCLVWVVTEGRGLGSTLRGARSSCSSWERMSGLGKKEVPLSPSWEFRGSFWPETRWGNSIKELRRGQGRLTQTLLQVASCLSFLSMIRSSLKPASSRAHTHSKWTQEVTGWRRNSSGCGSSLVFPGGIMVSVCGG